MATRQIPGIRDADRVRSRETRGWRRPLRSAVTLIDAEPVGFCIAHGAPNSRHAAVEAGLNQKQTGLNERREWKQRWRLKSACRGETCGPDGGWREESLNLIHRQRRPDFVPTIRKNERRSLLCAHRADAAVDGRGPGGCRHGAGRIAAVRGIGGAAGVPCRKGRGQRDKQQRAQDF